MSANVDKISSCVLASVLLFCILIATASGQFTTVLDIPPGPNIGDNQSIGSDTQVNLSDGGSIGDFFDVGTFGGTSSNMEVNITGGTVGRGLFARGSAISINISGGTVGSFFARDSAINISGGSIGDISAVGDGSVANISGGSIDELFRVLDGAGVNISGGTIGTGLSSRTGSTARIIGADFRVDGVPVTGLNSVGDTRLFTEFSTASVLSGTLADGTPFAFSSLESDRLINTAQDSFSGTLTLELAEVPAIGPPLIQSPGGSSLPLGIRNGQTLLVNEGGIVPNHFNAGRGSVVQINGGNVGRNFEAVDANVTITDGSIGNFFDAFGGTTVDISGGRFGVGFEAFPGSVVNISGGTFGRTFDGFHAYEGSSVRIRGDEFRLDGELLAGLDTVGDTLVLDERLLSVLSGTLADGTPFAFNLHLGTDIFDEGTITLEVADLPAVGPAVITVPTNDPVPLGIRESQTLVVESGGVVEDFFTAGRGSTVQVNGGEVGHGMEAVTAQIAVAGGSVGDYLALLVGSNLSVTSGSVGDHIIVTAGSTVNVSGGSIGSAQLADSSTMTITGGTAGRVTALGGSVIDVSGGTLVDGLRVFNTSTLNVSGGSVGDVARFESGSITNISGGRIGDRVFAQNNSTVNVSGGSFGSNFEAQANSNLRIIGGDFRLDGVPIDGLENIGSVLMIDASAESVLSGTLADGTPFAFSALDFDSLPNSVTLESAALPANSPALIVTPNEVVPLGIHAGQTLVVNSGGVVSDNFNAGHGSVLQLNDGEVGRNLEAVGAQVSIAGGTLGPEFDAFFGTTVDLTGGAIGDLSQAFAGSIVNMSNGSIGNDFNALAGSEINVSGGTIAARFLVRGAEVNISDGVVGDEFEMLEGSVVRMTGGKVGNSAVARGGEIDIQGGAVGDAFQAFVGSTINVSGGVIGQQFSSQGATVNLSDGLIGDSFMAESGSTINITGGLIGQQFSSQGATVNLSDGSIGDSFTAESGSTINISGGSIGDSFLADFGSNIEINISGGSIGDSFHALSRTTINISGGSIGTDFRTFGVVNVTGGVQWNDARFLLGGTLNVKGGEVGDDFLASGGGKVTVYDGTVGNGLTASNNGRITILGGTDGDSLTVKDRRSQVSIFGGTVGDGLTILDSGTATIQGGSIGDGVFVDADATFELIGRQFILDGVDISSLLTVGSFQAIVDRDVTLAGFLIDGSPFEFDLNSTIIGSEDYFSPSALVRIRIIPEPSAHAMGLVIVNVLICRRKRRQTLG